MLCKVKVVTDCENERDVFEEILISIKELEQVYIDLKETSRVVFCNKHLSAVNRNRLLSISILNEEIGWKDIVK